MSFAKCIRTTKAWSLPLKNSNKDTKAGKSPYHMVQFSSVVQLYPTLCSPVDCSTPGLPVPHQLPGCIQIMSIESVMPSNHLILCRPLVFQPAIFPSIRVFSNASVLCIRWPKYGLKNYRDQQLWGSVMQVSNWVSRHASGLRWVLKDQ